MDTDVKDKEKMMDFEKKPNIFQINNNSSQDIYKGKTVYRWKVSDERINRNGWKFITAGINLKEFLNNPVILFIHNRYTFPVGIALNTWAEGADLYADIWFHEETNESKFVKKMVDIGVFKMASIGLNANDYTEIPLSEEERATLNLPKWRTSYDLITKSELTEISIVPIPANTGAELKKILKNSLNTGILNDTEFEWMNQIINENITNKQKDEEDMADIQEWIQKFFKRDNDATTLENQNKVLVEEKKAFETQIANLATQLDTANNEIKTKDAQIAQHVEEINKYKSLQSQLQDSKIEAEVEAAISRLSNKILPYENNEQNQFELKRNLIHFKKNEETLKNADGISLYESKIKEIEARNNTIEQLKTPLSKPNLADEAGLSDDELKNMDIENDEDRLRINNEAERLSIKNNTSYATELTKIMERL